MAMKGVALPRWYGRRQRVIQRRRPRAGERIGLALGIALLISLFPCCRKKTSERAEPMAKPTATPAPSPMPTSTPTPSPEEASLLETLRAPARCRPMKGSEAWEWNGEPWARRVLHPQSGVSLALIVPGSFLMGSACPAEESAHYWGGEPAQYVAEYPLRQVTIAAPYYLGDTEVTVSSFKLFVRDTGYVTDAERSGKAVGIRDGTAGYHADMHWRDPGYKQNLRHPAACVSWNDATAFCRWSGFRLPSEAEWEYACRGGTDTFFSFGNETAEMEAYAWYGPNAGDRAHPVARKTPNAWGLHDMHGNLLEWCGDLWHGTYHNAPEDGTVWGVGGVQGMRVLRGGGWGSSPGMCRSAFRIRGPENVAVTGNGFRVARDLE